MSEESYDVAVIGAGGAGVMAHLRAVLNADRSVIFLGDAETKRKGRSTWVMHVDNIPGMHDLNRPIGASGTSTLKWIDSQQDLRGYGTQVKAAATAIERDGEGFVVRWKEKGGEERALKARFVILATGVMDVQPEIGGSIQPILPFANRADVHYCIRCDGHKTIGKRLTLLGERDSAIWIATMMVDRYGHEHVDILTNGLEADFSAQALEAARAYGFDFHHEPIVGVLGDPKGEGLEGYELQGGKRIESTVSIVAMGSIVYNELLTALGGEVDAAGKVVVSDSYETSIPNLFAVGDLVAGKKMQVYTAWDEAVDAADEINARIRAEKRRARLAAARAD